MMVVLTRGREGSENEFELVRNSKAEVLETLAGDKKQGPSKRARTSFF